MASYRFEIAPKCLSINPVSAIRFAKSTKRALLKS